jgi:hypothetical protein
LDAPVDAPEPAIEEVANGGSQSSLNLNLLSARAYSFAGTGSGSLTVLLY